MGCKPIGSAFAGSNPAPTIGQLRVGHDRAPDRKRVGHDRAPVIALVLGLAASLCWGFADFLGGLKAKHIPALVVVFFGQLGSLAVLAAVLAISGRGVPGDVLLPAALAGLTAAIGLAAFYRALAVGTMGVVAPVVATSAVIPVVAGIVSGERLGVVQAAGLALAVAGVTLSVRSRPDDAPRSAGIGIAALAAVALGASIVFIERAAEHDVAATLLVARCAGLATLAVALAATSTALRAPREQLPALFGIGLLDMAATGLFALATTHGLLSVAAVAASLYPAVTVVLARVALRERLSRVQVLGIAAVLVGVCLLAGASA
jgi:drug/metabolite transporter (DMT)-like permease